MENYNSIWLTVKNKLADVLKDESTFQNTFGDINEVYKVNNGYIYLPVNGQLDKYRIEKFHLEKMNNFLKELVSEKMSFKLITKEDIEKEKENLEKKVFVSPDSTDKFKSRTLRPEYTFENFVTGEANREAFTFSTKVADSPANTANPLYIFGDVGLGKTHLMTAIGHFILDNDINANVIFTTAQQYTEDYFAATNKKNRDCASSTYI